MYVLSFHVMSPEFPCNVRKWAALLCSCEKKKKFTADHMFENEESKVFGIFVIDLVEERLVVS